MNLEESKMSPDSTNLETEMTDEGSITETPNIIGDDIPDDTALQEADTTEDDAGEENTDDEHLVESETALEEPAADLPKTSEKAETVTPTANSAPATRSRRRNVASDRVQNQPRMNMMSEDFMPPADAPLHDTERSREINKLYKAMRDKTVEWAVVQRVDAPSATGNVLIHALYGNSTWVCFIAKDFLAESERFAIIAEDPDDKKRGNRWSQACRRYVGALVSFMVLKIDRDDTGAYTVFASRALAMQNTREKNFFAANAHPENGKIGKASIIDSRPNRIVVEFYGMEVKIYNGELTAFQYLPDASKDSRFRTGNVIWVMIQRCNIDKEKKTVTLALSHASVELTSNNIPPVSETLIGAETLGHIIIAYDNVSDESRKTKYVAVLDGMACRCLISGSSDRSYGALNIGDKAMIKITSIVSTSAHTIRGICYKI